MKTKTFNIKQKPQKEQEFRPRLSIFPFKTSLKGRIGKGRIGIGTNPAGTPKERKPYSCPVCGGRGNVPAGFYNSYTSNTGSTIPETCRSCGGAGIVWGVK